MLHVRCRERETDCQNDQLGDQRCAGCQGGMEEQGDVVGRANLKEGRTLEMEIHMEEIK